MAISFGKRENEKKKQAKRLEKQKRKEERKANGPATPEEMIAYMDEHGNITDTPPEKGIKADVKLEEIEVSVPRKEAEEPAVLKGRVEYFNEEKGYGFIKDMGTSEKYFFHISDAPAEIAQNNTVNFETVRGTRGMNAVNIVLIK